MEATPTTTTTTNRGIYDRGPASYLDMLYRWSTVFALIYAAIFLVDCVIHFKAGWDDAATERDQILAARYDCKSLGTSGTLRSELLQGSCSQILALRVPIPWQRAVHHTAQHLSDKMASTVQGLLALAIVCLIVFLCMMRWSPQNHNLPLPDLLSRFWMFGRSQDSTEPLASGSNANPARRPQAVVVQIPETVWDQLQQRQGGASTASKKQA